MARALSLLALVGAAIALAGCGGGSTTAAEPVDVEQLSQAAATSAKAPSGRFELALSSTFPGAKSGFDLTASGAFDTKADRAEISLDLGSLAGLLGAFFGSAGAMGDKRPFDLGNAGGWKIDAIQDGAVVYLRFPAIADLLPDGKTWVRVDASQAGNPSPLGFDLSDLQAYGGDDPRSLLDALEAVSGDLETVGTEELRGVATTHYRASIDPSKVDEVAPPAKRDKLSDGLREVLEGSGLDEVPLDVWLDEDGLVRKFEVAVSAEPQGASDPVESSASLELYDYGSDVDIAVPPAEDVADESALSD
jgi:hypothetical protein